jgi:hypothetical protein
VNALCRSVQNILLCRFLYKNVKVNITITIIVLFDLYGCETWSLILRSIMSVNTMQGRKRMEKWNMYRNTHRTYTWRSLHLCILNAPSSQSTVRFIHEFLPTYLLIKKPGDISNPVYERTYVLSTNIAKIHEYKFLTFSFFSTDPFVYQKLIIERRT